MQDRLLRGLLEKCVDGTPSACDEMVDSIRPLFQSIALRVARQYRKYEERDDLAQEMCVKVFSSKLRLLASLPSEDGAARAYLAALGTNAARDYFRGKGQQRDLVPLTDGMQNLRVLVGFDSRLDKDLLFDQIEAALPPGRETTLFRLYYRQGFSVSEIAAIPSLELSVKAAESIILRMGRRLKEQFAGKAATGAS